MLFGIRFVEMADKSFWFTLDNHFSEQEFELKVRDKRGYVICNEKNPIGVMRYNLFWDNTPFLTMIYLDKPYHGRGFGRLAMAFWEEEMRRLGYKMVMTSMQTDEEAQHFYRKLGYIEKGSLLFDNTPYEQPMEILMMKVL